MLSRIHRNTETQMKFGAIFACLFILFSALALALPQDADAARMGGGRSFGSKPFMNRPAAPPAAARQQAAPAQAPAAAARPGMFGGMGGIMGGLLAGTLLGSLLSGNGFGGGGFLDIILLAILAFIAYKLFMRFKNRPAPEPAASGAGGMFDSLKRSNDQPMARQNLQDGWGALGGKSQAPEEIASPQVNIPAGFDVDEFLRGAKMAYNRLQKDWNSRDLADIARFATPAVMSALKEQLAEDPNPSSTEIMLVNAQLLEVEKDGGDERAKVYFDVLMRERPDQPAPEAVREIWHFVRSGSSGEWKLDGIQQVE